MTNKVASLNATVPASIISAYKIEWTGWNIAKGHAWETKIRRIKLSLTTYEMKTDEQINHVSISYMIRESDTRFSTSVFFSWISVPRAHEYPIRVVSTFFRIFVEIIANECLSALSTKISCQTPFKKKLTKGKDNKKRVEKLWNICPR